MLFVLARIYALFVTPHILSLSFDLICNIHPICVTKSEIVRRKCMTPTITHFRKPLHILTLSAQATLTDSH